MLPPKWGNVLAEKAHGLFNFSEAATSNLPLCGRGILICGSKQKNSEAILPW